MKRTIITAVVFCLFSVAVCNAQSYERKNIHMGLELGAFLPSGSFEIGGVDYDFEPGFEFGFKFTGYFNDYIGLTGRLSGVGFNSETWTINSYDTHFEFVTVGLAAGLALRFPVAQRADLLLDGGAVFNINNAKYIGKRGNTEITGEEDDSCPGFFVDAGARFYLTEMVTLGALVRYTTNSQDIEDYDEDVDLNGVSILLEVGFAL